MTGASSTADFSALPNSGRTLKPVDVNQARAFLAVAEELHFGRAALRLHMAQPPLSRLIRALEAQLGVTLFERSPRKVSLTPAGEALIEPARELLMQSERIRPLLQRVQRGEIGRVRLGFSGASVNSIVSAIVRAVRARRPGIGIELYGSQLSSPGMERLRSHALDAIVGRWDVLPRDVASHVVAHEELVIALPDNHRLVSAERITAADLADESWIVLPGGGGATLSTRLHELSIRGRFVPKIVATAPDSATQLLMVDAGNGIALTFSGVRENIPLPTVVYRPLAAELAAVEVRLAWRASDANPALAELVRIVKTMPPVTGPRRRRGRA